ncbi:Lrp/AsnC family transcriptional regulator [Paracoccus sp. p4-l81]|uniref:Lrp/AsnC family transcriptional regulator n=1 Tax=unclassified Paracoccus (in: a-proteobacteria) TaxID=2688777 RepID=UPI0035BB4EB8
MMKSVQLTDLDRRILAALQQDASLSQAELAARVASSPASCWRRVRALEQAGVLGRAVRIVSPRAVGRGLDVFCQLRMKAHDTATRRAFEGFLTTLPEIVSIYSTSGEWDYLIHFVVTDMAEYESLLMHRVLAQDCVAQSSTTFAMKRIKSTTALPV